MGIQIIVETCFIQMHIRKPQQKAYDTYPFYVFPETEVKSMGAQLLNSSVT